MAIVPEQGLLESCSGLMKVRYWAGSVTDRERVALMAPECQWAEDRGRGADVQKSPVAMGAFLNLGNWKGCVMIEDGGLQVPGGHSHVDEVQGRTQKRRSPTNLEEVYKESRSLEIPRGISDEVRVPKEVDLQEKFRRKLGDIQTSQRDPEETETKPQRNPEKTRSPVRRNPR